MRTELPAGRARRGLTLIELLVTIAMASVLISAAVAVFVTISQQLRAAERRVETSTAAVTANSIIQLDLQNTGYRFPSAAFAVRVYNNVDSSTSLSGPTAITTTGNCGSSSVGLVPGTDVLQVAQGFEPVAPGIARQVVPNSATEYAITLETLGAPFDSSERSDDGGVSTALNTLILVAEQNQRAYLMRVTDLTSNVVTAKFVDRDYADALSTYYPATPTVDSHVYRMGRVVRYMLCAPTTGTIMQRALYRQVGDGTGTFLAPEIMQDGVEDLQVSVRYSDPNSTVSSSGTAASCVGTGSGRWCYCDDDPTSPSCTLIPAEENPGASTPIETKDDPATASWVARARGVRVLLTAISQRAAHDMSSGLANVRDDLRRPAAFDHAEMPVASKDGYLRVQQATSIQFHNFEVVP